jgi:ubiquinone/menaquinone biosynthesis C-methylase UbiE
VENFFKEYKPENLNAGIYDNCPDLPKETPYNRLDKKIYDFWVKNQLLMKLVWGVDLKELNPLSTRLGSLFQDTKNILDVPCGTGGISLEVYKAFPDKQFIAVDFSLDMLQTLKKRCEYEGINNVIFVRADVSKLPFKESAVDVCMSLNGFHAFPEPQKAAQEIGRVCKGSMLVTVVCAGERAISDFFIKRIMIPKGFFTNFMTIQDYIESARLAFNCEKVERHGAVAILHFSHLKH